MRVATLLVAALLIAGALAQDPASYCSGIKPTSPKNNVYDLTWWAGKAPFTTMDRTNTYTFTFSICSTLPQPCLDNADPGGTSVCSAPGSAYTCQSWPNPSSPQTPYTACCASKTVPPTFTEYSSGSDIGIIATYGGGDDCGQCTPSARKTQYTIICDATTRDTPNIVAADSAQAPDPTYKFEIRHCSGCPRGSPGYCGGGGGALSGGSILLIILVVVFAVYFMGGFVFFRFAKHKEGKEAIPNYEFWSDLPALCKDGVRLIISPCSGGSSYETVKG